MKVHSFENHQNIYLMILDVQKIVFPKKDLYLRIKYEVHEVWPNPLFMFFITFTMYNVSTVSKIIKTYLAK